MASRYDLMKNSNVKGTDGTPYKDPLTFAQKEMRLDEDPEEYSLRRTDIERFDLFIARSFQGYNIYKDLVLQYNGQEYQWDYESEDIILVPEKEDLLRFVRNNRE